MRHDAIGELNERVKTPYEDYLAKRISVKQMTVIMGMYESKQQRLSDRISELDPLQISWKPTEDFCLAMCDLIKRRLW